MKKALIYILVFMFINISFSSPKWYIETVDNTEYVGDNTSIELNSNDYPHISYAEYNYDGELRYAYFDGSKWNIEIVDEDTGPGGAFTSLVLDKYDHPHIAYTDYGSLICAYYDGLKWNMEMVDIGSCYLSIDLDSKEYPHISYCDGNKNDLKYSYYDGTKWNIETVDSNGKVGWYTSITIDKNNHPHISYDDETNWHLKYAYFDGTKWNIETIDDMIFTGRYSSIALDSKDQPHISYQRGGGLGYAYFDGSKWNIETVDNDHAGGYTSLALDSNDYPHISYNYWQDPDIVRLMYIYFDGEKWHKEIVDYEPNKLVGVCTSIALDRYDYPHISYYKNANLGYARYGYGLGITLTSFTAMPGNDAITLNWTISTDEDISGFNLYRRIVPPGVIHELPLQTPVGTDYNMSTTACEDTYPRTDTNTQWTKINTSHITGTNPYSYTDKNVLPETKYEYKLEAVISDRSETLGTTSVTSGNENPSSFEITKIYPTPAVDSISIDVVLPEQVNIEITIYDITGRKVSTVARGLCNPGEYTLTSDVSWLTNGVYIVRMTTDSGCVSKNFVVAR